jgi:CubicO group peptidase (beta-lactamase class C family)
MASFLHKTAWAQVKYCFAFAVVDLSFAPMNSSTTARILIASVLLAPFVSRAEDVDDYVKAEMNKQHIPGLALVVVKNGHVDKSAAYGLANVELNVPVRTDTIFQIQSITKTFTASAVMLLVEEGKIGLDDKITKHLDNLPESWKEITVRHLLSHTSGIKDFINEPTVDMRKDIQPEDVIESLRKLPLNFQPGEKYAYSNTGYHLLAMIIRKVTGQYWGEFLKERILDPLEMNNTRVISLASIITNRAAGYLWENGELRNGRFIAPTILAYAGGGLRSTVLDLAKWDAALYTEKILKRSTLDQMWTPMKLNDGSNSSYGLGWGVTNYHGHRLISHTGSHMTGFKTALARFVDDKLTVIVFTNQREAEQMAIARGVAGFHIPELQVRSAKN